MARTGMVRRWRENMDVSDDHQYVEMLTTLSEGSVRRNFNTYTDIDWESPEFAVVPDDPRWILPGSDPIGGHPWYQEQPVERQIAIGMWRRQRVWPAVVLTAMASIVHPAVVMPIIAIVVVVAHYSENCT